MTNGKETTFIGLEAVANIRYRTTRNEDTRCYFCKNNCLRTFIDVDVTAAQPSHDHDHTSAPALAVAEIKGGQLVAESRTNPGQCGRPWFFLQHRQQ